MSKLRYPAWRYHKSGESKIIQDHSEEHKDWAPSPDDHQKGVVKIDPVEAAVAKFKAEEKAAEKAAEVALVIPGDVPVGSVKPAKVPKEPKVKKEKKPAKV